MGRELLDILQALVQAQGLLCTDIPLEARLAQAVKIQGVRDILEIEAPQITDLTGIVSKDEGKVYAIRMDLLPSVQNHKKPVVAALMLRNVLQRKIPNEQKDTFIDGGNFNSALAVKYYAQKFGMKGMYIMSRLFPDEIIGFLESEDFRIMKAPKKYEQKREREFYEFLFQQMRREQFSENKVCLWHAKYGGRTHYPIGIEIAAQVPQDLDYIVSCLGAGSTLEGIQIPIQDYFVKSERPVPKIVIAEHELSPLFSSQYTSKVMHIPRTRIGEHDSCGRAAPFLPTDIIGPHFDEINPLLAHSSIDRINAIVQYADQEWRTMQNMLFAGGIRVGNSSAANIAVAAKLAGQGNRVLTVIFEPYWSFYAKTWV